MRGGIKHHCSENEETNSEEGGKEPAKKKEQITPEVRCKRLQNGLQSFSLISISSVDLVLSGLRIGGYQGWISRHPKRASIRLLFVLSSFRQISEGIERKNENSDKFS